MTSWNNLRQKGFLYTFRSHYSVYAKQPQWNEFLFIKGKSRGEFSVKVIISENYGITTEGVASKLRFLTNTLLGSWKSAAS